MELALQIIVGVITLYYLLRLFNIKSAKVEKRGFWDPWFSKDDGVHSEKLDTFLTKSFRFIWIASIIGLFLWVYIYIF